MLTLSVEDNFWLDVNNKKIGKFKNDELFHVVFEQIIHTFPKNQTAIICDEEECTYYALNNKANQIASILLQNNFPKESCIGVFMEPCIDWVVTILAIWKAGLVYVPLDTNGTSTRIKLAVESAKPTLIISHNRLKNHLLFPEHDQHKILFLDKIFVDKEFANPSVNVIPSQLAYIFFTSGTTSKPKGVAIEHKGLFNCFLAAKETLSIKHDDKIAQQAGIGFDASVWELMIALVSGATSCIVPIYQKENVSKELYRYFEAKQITIATFTPSQLAQLNHQRFQYLELIISTGELLPKPVFEKWYNQLELNRSSKNKVCQRPLFIDGYGPTEVTICTTLASRNKSESFHLGKPIKGLEIFILKKHPEQVQKLIPVINDEEGEVYIGGIGLARGYFPLEDAYLKKLNEERFIHYNGTLVFKTGDRGKWNPQHQLVLLGRNEALIKIYGEQYSKNEIEAELSTEALRCEHLQVDYKEVKREKLEHYFEHPAITAYFSTAENDSTWKKGEVAFFYNRAKQISKFLPSRWIKIIQKELPPPLPVSGKKDTDTLIKNFHAKGIYYQVETETIEDPLMLEVAEVWESVLQIKKYQNLVSGIAFEYRPDDEFYQLGGTSLQVALLLKNLYKKFNVNIQYQDFVQSPVLKNLTRFIRRQQDKTLKSPIIELHSPKSLHELSDNNSETMSLSDEQREQVINKWDTQNFEPKFERYKVTLTSTDLVTMLFIQNELSVFKKNSGPRKIITTSEHNQKDDEEKYSLEIFYDEYAFLISPQFIEEKKEQLRKNKPLKSIDDKTKPYLFLIHSLLGNPEEDYRAFSFASLNFSVYGVKARGLVNGILDASDNMLEIARDYIQQIKHLQPKGPYIVAGWSLGGVIAYVIACELEKQNEPVSIYCIDSECPILLKQLSIFDLRNHYLSLLESKLNLTIEPKASDLSLTDSELTKTIFQRAVAQLKSNDNEKKAKIITIQNLLLAELGHSYKQPIRSMTLLVASATKAKWETKLTDKKLAARLGWPHALEFHHLRELETDHDQICLKEQHATARVVELDSFYHEQLNLSLLNKFSTYAKVSYSKERTVVFEPIHPEKKIELSEFDLLLKELSYYEKSEYQKFVKPEKMEHILIPEKNNFNVCKAEIFLEAIFKKNTKFNFIVTDPLEFKNTIFLKKIMTFMTEQDIFKNKIELVLFLEGKKLKQLTQKPNVTPLFTIIESLFSDAYFQPMEVEALIYAISRLRHKVLLLIDGLEQLSEIEHRDILEALKFFISQPSAIQFIITSTDVNMAKNRLKLSDENFIHIQFYQLLWNEKPIESFLKNVDVIPESLDHYVIPPDLDENFDTSLPEKNRLFVGREEIIRKIKNGLLPSKLDESQLRVVICTSSTATGKTEIAVEFAYRHLNEFDRCYWLYASDPLLLFYGFLDIAKKNNLLQSKSEKINQIELVNAVHDFFQKKSCLLIFDGAFDHKTIHAFLPRSHCAVLITTRYQKWYQDTLNIPDFNKAEAMSFLSKCLPRRPPEQYQRLSAYCQHQVHALFLVCCFIRKEKLTIDSFLANLAHYHFEENFTTSALVNYMIKKGNFTSKLMLICSFFDNLSIPFFFIEEVAKHPETNEEHEILSVALDTLQSYSLIQFNPNKNSLLMSKEIKEILQKSLLIMPPLIIDFLKVLALIIEMKVMLEKNVLVQIHMIRALTPHVKNFYRIAKEMITTISNPIEQKEFEMLLLWRWSDLLHQWYNQLGMPEQSTVFSHEHYLIETKYKTEHSFETIIPFLKLIQARFEQGDILEAEQQFKEVLTSVPATRPDVKVAILNSLAKIAADKNQQDEQAKHFNEVRAIVEKEQIDLFEPELMMNLSVLYTESGKSIKAKEIALNALDKFQAQYGAQDCADIARALHTLGNIEGDLGNINEKIQYMKQALDMFQRLYGEEHLDVAQTYVCLANAYQQLHHHADAIELLEKALNIQNRYLSSNHHDLGSTYLNLKTSYLAVHDIAKALYCQEQMLKIAEHCFDKNDFQVIELQFQLAESYVLIAEDYINQKQEDEIEPSFLTKALCLFFDIHHYYLQKTVDTLEPEEFRYKGVAAKRMTQANWVNYVHVV